MKIWICGIVFLLLAAGGFSSPLKRDLVLYRHPDRYSAFPSLVKSPQDELWVSFGWNNTRSHYGPASGGKRGHVSLYSPDAGQNWYQAGKDPAYKPRPEEFGPFVLEDGSLLGIWPRFQCDPAELLVVDFEGVSGLFALPVGHCGVPRERVDERLRSRHVRGLGGVGRSAAGRTARPNGNRRSAGAPQRRAPSGLRSILWVSEDWG